MSPQNSSSFVLNGPVVFAYDRKMRVSFCCGIQFLSIVSTTVSGSYIANFHSRMFVFEKTFSLALAGKLRNILQKEMLLYATPKTTWKINQDPTRINTNVDVNGEWSLTTAKNHTIKSWNKDKVQL